MCTRKILCTFLFLVAATCGFSQQLMSEQYISPLTLPISLSANFGEIRANHFHSGIDLKTQGVTGKTVLSVADGHVSRISVSPWGYGLALYIDHPRLGTTSVYGHLEKFAPQIQEYVREYQYSQKSFAVNLYPSKDKFPVKQGEIVAYSGNSGSSGGPHVHFEIRNSVSQKTLNVLTRNIYRVKDDIRPTIFNVRLVEVDTIDNVPVHTIRRTYTVRHTGNGNYRLTGDTLPVGKPSYFAVEVTDRKNDVSNIFGVYKMELRRKDKPIFGFELDSFSFTETRYINSFVYYSETNKNRNDVIRTYISPNNRLSIYRNTVRRGVIDPRTIEGIEQLVLDVWDEAGNKSTLTFHIRKSETPSAKPSVSGIPVHWASNFSEVTSDYRIYIPSGALYESMLLKVEASSAKNSPYSVVVAVQDKSVPLQKSMQVSLKAELPQHLQSKALIVDQRSGGGISSIGGKWENGWITASTNTFGTFRVAVDTLPPKITPKFQPGANLSGQMQIAFTISDNLSGIDSWNVTIDGKWALFEYDPKTATILHRLDSKRTDKGKVHTVEAVVTDAKGNRNTYNGTFTW